MKDFYDIAGHQGLDEGVTGREFGPAMPAAATQQQVGKNGNVVAGEHAGAAGEAMRRRRDHRHAAWNTRDAHVEKAAPQGAEAGGAYKRWNPPGRQVFTKGWVHT